MNKKPGRCAIIALLMAALFFSTSACSASSSASSQGIIGGAFAPVAIPVSSGSSGGTSAAQATATDLHREISNGNITMEVTLGYEGATTYSKWIPISVILSNRGSDIAGSIAVNTYRNTTYYDRYEIPVTLAAGATQRVILPVRVNMKQDTFTVELIQNGVTIAAVNKRPEKVISPYAMLVGLLSEDPQSLKYIDITAENDTLKRSEYWQSVGLDAETFPEEEKLMSSFGLLLVDGFDVRSLSEKQQNVLLNWIETGGIVLLGGGATAQTSYAWFAEHTGITSGDVYEAAGLTGALNAHVGISGSVSGNTLFNEMEGGEILVSLDEKNVLAMSKLGSGVVFTAAFELGTRSFTQWEGAHSIWQRILIEDAPNEYSYTYGNRGSQNNDYRGSLSSLATSTPVKNSGTLWGAYCVLLLSILIAGFGGYFVLKKLDRREWLWLLVPLCAAGASALVLLMSRSTDLNTPIAAEIIVWSVDEDGNIDTSLAAAVAYPDTEETLISLQNGMDFTLTNDYYYYYEEDESQSRAPYLQYYRYVMGDSFAIGNMPSAAWDTVSLVGTLDSSSLNGDFTGSVWMEEDGLHVEAVNHTDYDMHNAVFLCNLGFVRLGEIKRGETVTGLLGHMDGEDAKAEENMYAYSEGVLGNRGDIYDVTYSLYSAVLADDNDQEANNYLRNTIYSLMDSWYANNNYDTYSVGFRLVAFMDEIESIPVEINGQAVGRTGAAGILDAGLGLEPIGRTGIVYYPAGSIPVYRASLNEQGLPQMGTERVVDYSYEQGSVICGFSLGEAAKAEISSIHISTQAYGSSIATELYNFSTGAWDEQTIALYIELDGETAANYIGPSGEMYLRYVSTAYNNNYVEFQAPAVSVEGRVK